MYTPKGKYRIELRLADGKVVRVSVKKRHGDGSNTFPWSIHGRKKIWRTFRGARGDEFVGARNLGLRRRHAQSQQARRSRRNSQKKPASNGLYAPMSPV